MAVLDWDWQLCAIWLSCTAGQSKPLVKELAIFTAAFPLLSVSRDGSDVESARSGQRSAGETSFSILKGLCVLVVDDEPEARDLITIALMGRRGREGEQHSPRSS